MAGVCVAILLKVEKNVIPTQIKVYPKPIAITFDDGPNETYTALLLDELEKRNIKASFFVIGEKAKENPELIKRIKESGHLLGNHTFSHIYLEEGNRQQYLDELVQTNNILEEITGQEISFVRPPFGKWEKDLEDQTNLIPVFWTIDPLDWCNYDVNKIVNCVVRNAKENDIILLHDNYDTSVQAALEIIDILTKNNFYFVTVDEILFD